MAFDLVFRSEQWSLVSTGSRYGIIIPAQQIETRARVGAVQLLCPLSGCFEPSLSDRAHSRFARRGSLITRGTSSCLGYAPGCSVSKKQYELGLKIEGEVLVFPQKKPYNSGTFRIFGPTRNTITIAPYSLPRRASKCNNKVTKRNKGKRKKCS